MSLIASANGVKLTKKNKFRDSSVKYLGHVFSRKGMTNGCRS